MNPKFLLVLMVLWLAGCVQQTVYSGTDQPVAENKYDAYAAAQERVALGLAYLRRGDAVQAKFNLDKALRQAPGSDKVLAALAYYFQSVSDSEQAEIYYKRALAANPNSADAANNYGVFLCRLRRFEESDKWLRAAVGMPDYIRQAQTYENLGLCAKQAGWDEKALGYFIQALNYDGRREVSLLEAARLSLDLDKPNQARGLLERFHNSGRQSAASLYLGVELEMSAEDTDAARRYGVLLLAKYPSSKQAQRYRTKYY